MCHGDLSLTVAFDTCSVPGLLWAPRMPPCPGGPFCVSSGGSLQLRFQLGSDSVTLLLKENFFSLSVKPVQFILIHFYLVRAKYYLNV